MHVLIIPSWYPAFAGDVGGSFFREQAIALCKRGHDVGVINPQLASLRRPATWATTFRVEEVANDEGVRTYRSPGLNWFPKVPRASTKAWINKGMRLFERYARDNGMPDILHAHSMFHGGLLAEQISHEFDIPYVITEHSTAFARGLVYEWQITAGARAAKKASAILAVSSELARLLDRDFELARNSWSYLPNIVSEQFAEAPLATKSVAVGKSFKFCNIAYLTPKKGIDVLLRAFAMAFDDQPETKLIIGGDGEDRAYLELLAHELGLSTQVEFRGHLDREEVLAVIASSDAFVLSSHHETFGVVLIESLALGKPVVATRCGGPESIVRPGDGVLVKKGSARALADGMTELKRNFRKYEAPVIREACLARFSEEVVVSRLSEIYVNALTDRIDTDD